jgi:endonuclease/exonuclease/phosphatase family metal-dependent hydrolase
MKRIIGFFAAALIIAGAQILSRHQNKSLVTPSEQQTLRDAPQDNDAYALLEEAKRRAAGTSDVQAGAVAAGQGSTALSPPPPQKGEFSPKVVSSVEAFSLTKQDIADVFAHGGPAATSKLGAKLQAVMSQVYYSAGSAAAQANPNAIRVASWNVNDPIDESKVEDLASVLKGDDTRLARTNKRVEAELAGLAKTDIYMLQEVPLPAAIAAAQANGYSLLWAPEFLEVGKKTTGRDPSAAQDFTGNAILSKYELSGFRVLRFSRQADWYNEEKRQSLPLPEKISRAVATKGTGVDIDSQEARAPVPYGGRAAMAATAAVPYKFSDAKGKGILIVNIHLENKAKPDLRRDQMKEAVQMIRQADVPTIFGGDLNTTGRDGRIQTKKRFIASQFDTKMKVIEKGIGIGLDFAGLPTGVSEAKTAFDAWKFFHSKGDPTSRFNREHQLFDVPRTELGVKPVNEQNNGGVMKYKNTWSTPKPKHLGNAVLDWMFVYDPMGNMQASDSKTYEHLVRDSAKKGAKSTDDYLSDHFPIGATITLTDEE